MEKIFTKNEIQSITFKHQLAKYYHNQGVQGVSPQFFPRKLVLWKNYKVKGYLTSIYV